jgi:hypothetical protein
MAQLVRQTHSSHSVITQVVNNSSRVEMYDQVYVNMSADDNMRRWAAEVDNLRRMERAYKKPSTWDYVDSVKKSRQQKAENLWEQKQLKVFEQHIA